jgi:hypothetical protein
MVILQFIINILDRNFELEAEHMEALGDDEEFQEILVDIYEKVNIQQ